jgi:hypothetical protein
VKVFCSRARVRELVHALLERRLSLRAPGPLVLRHRRIGRKTGGPISSLMGLRKRAGLTRGEPGNSTSFSKNMAPRLFAGVWG